MQVIVETHSDHILNGVLVAAKMYESADARQQREGLDRQNVRIYYVEKDAGTPTEAVATKIEIEDGGRLKYQPNGFFDQAEKDLVYLMEG